MKIISSNQFSAGDHFNFVKPKKIPGDNESIHLILGVRKNHHEIEEGSSKPLGAG